MARKKTTTYMTSGEQIAGVIFFVIYLLVLPFATDPLFELAEKLLKVSISSSVQNMIYYYILFAVTIIIFHRYIGNTCRRFADNLGEACKTVVIGLVGLYGLNELVYRASNFIITNRTNLNDTTISAQIDDAPRLTLIIIVLIAPFVEEVLFRGLVFGNLKGKSLVVGYVLSCLLFALSHVWEFIIVEQSISQFLLMVKYLVPGFMLAWAYDRSGTLWTSIALHAAVNALALWT